MKADGLTGLGWVLGVKKKYTSPNQEMNQTDAPVLFPGWMHKGRLNQALSYPSSLLMCFVFTLGLLLSYLVILWFSLSVFCLWLGCQHYASV